VAERIGFAGNKASIVSGEKAAGMAELLRFLFTMWVEAARVRACQALDELLKWPGLFDW